MSGDASYFNNIETRAVIKLVSFLVWLRTYQQPLVFS